MCDVNISLVLYVFFFKQKTAYEMRISDWSSDVCSSDLAQQVQQRREQVALGQVAGGAEQEQGVVHGCRDQGIGVGQGTDRVGDGIRILSFRIPDRRPRIPALKAAALPASRRAYRSPESTSAHCQIGRAHD